MSVDLVAINAIQMAFDYSEYSPELAASLEQHAINMEGFTKRYVADMGKELAEAKAEIHAEKQTGWAKWVEGRLGITVQWADKIIRQFEQANSETKFQNAIEQPVEPVEEDTEPRLKRTSNEEKRQTVEAFIAETPQWQELSNREIARICGVSESLVRTIRKELFSEPEPELPIEVEPEPAQTVESTLKQVEPEPEIEQPQELEQPQEEPEPENTEVESALDPVGVVEEEAEIELIPEPEEESEYPQEPAQLEMVEPEPKLEPQFFSFMSENNEWYTPKVYVDAARELMGGIDLDPASSQEANVIVKSADYYTIHDDGLVQPWYGRVWLNPPYGKDNGKSNQETWTNRLIEQVKLKNVKEAILLVNASTEATWFQPLYDYAICFTDHRIRFYNADSDQPTKGNALVYFGPQEKRQKFINIFSKFGVVVRKEEPKHE